MSRLGRSPPDQCDSQPGHDEPHPGEVRPARNLLQVEDRESQEHRQSNTFLQDLQPRCCERSAIGNMPNPVCRHRQAILGQGEKPADRNDGSEREAVRCQMPGPTNVALPADWGIWQALLLGTDAVGQRL